MRVLSLTARSDIHLPPRALLQKGVVEGLDITHFMASAVSVAARVGQPSAPRWELRDCDIASSRRNMRSATAIQMTDVAGGPVGGILYLHHVTIESTIHAVWMRGGPSYHLSCHGCLFTNTKEAIVTAGGGCVHVEASTFAHNMSAFLLDALTVGWAKGNQIVDASGKAACKRTHGREETFTSAESAAQLRILRDISYANGTCVSCGQCLGGI